MRGSTSAVANTLSRKRGLFELPSPKNSTFRAAFTIVELLIVVVVIAILAAITIVAYNGITALTTAIGATSNAAGSTTLRSTWLAQYAGYWSGGFLSQGVNGYYWSATQHSTANARNLSFGSSNVTPSNNGGKNYGFSVRCIAV